MKKWRSVLAGLAVLAAGGGVLAGMTLYGQSRHVEVPPPAEDSLHVRAITAQPGDYPVTLQGFGTVAALREVSVAPEVAGRIVEAHPEFKSGGSVNEGDVIIRIDPSLYQSALNEAEAALRQQEAMVERLRKEWENEKVRHGALEQTAALAERDFARAQELERKGVGSKVEVDRAERGQVEAASQRDLHARDLEVFPMRLREAEAMMDSVRAGADSARQALERTHVRAPFSGSIKTKMVDLGQVVAVGTAIALLTDDSTLEITAPIDSREVRDWMRFTGGDGSVDDASRYSQLEQVDCLIRWAEEDNGVSWAGRLDRVVGYDEAIRMVQVVVTHKPAEHTGPFPLLAGMFCRVEIPGKPMNGVYQLPSESVGFDNSAYKVVDNRLKMIQVDVLREEKAFTYVSAGLSPGDVVVTTRLLDALDNTLLEVDLAEASAPGAAPAS